MSAVFLVTGAPASGKTTVARLLAERFPRGAAVSGDAYRRAIVSGRVEPNPQPDGGLSEAAMNQLALRYRIAASVADQYADAGFTAVWQDIVIGPVLASIPTMVRTRPFHVVVLAPHADTLRSRNAARGKDGYQTWTGAALDTALRTTTPRLGTWLDTTDQTPDQTVDAILAATGADAGVPHGQPT